jgi:hypothetical protein
LKKYLVEKRNSKIQSELQREYSTSVMNEDLRVFCVSNTDYQKHRNDERSVAQKQSDLSGIIDLRKYCQSIPAEAQFRAVVAFLNHQVPTLMGSIRQWVLQGSDGMTVEKADTLRRLLDQCEEQFQYVRLGRARQSRGILIKVVGSYTVQTARESGG